MQLEVDKNGQMIARNLGVLVSASTDSQDLQGTSVVDPVQPSSRRKRRIGLDGSGSISCRAIRGTPKFEALDKIGPEHRTPVVEIATQDARLLYFQTCHLSRSGQEPGLSLPFAGGETEMKIEDLQKVGMTRGLLHMDSGVLTPPAFSATDRQIDIALPDDGKATGRSIAVPAFPETYIVPQGEVLQPDLAGQLPRQVHLSRPGDPFIDLLQQHHIGFVIREDGRNSLRAKASVHTDRTVDIVCGQTKFHLDPRRESISLRSL